MRVLCFSLFMFMFVTFFVRRRPFTVHQNCTVRLFAKVCWRVLVILRILAFRFLFFSFSLFYRFFAYLHTISYMCLNLGSFSYLLSFIHAVSQSVSHSFTECQRIPMKSVHIYWILALFVRNLVCDIAQVLWTNNKAFVSANKHYLDRSISCSPSHK